MLVTDPADRKVPEPGQTDFAKRLRDAGGWVDQFLVQATDEDRHGVLPYAHTAAIGCLRGSPTEEIGARLAREVELALAAKAAGEARRQADARGGAARAPAR
jgi:hypothetical protein